MEEEIDTILLYDEDGVETEFEIITKLDLEDKEYFIVVPIEDDDCEEAIALRVDKNEKGEEVLVTVEEDKEYALVSEAFEAIMSEGILN